MLGQLFLCLMVASALAQSQAPAGDIETVLTQRQHYSMFLDLIRTAGLMDAIKQAPQVTVFAPTNQAISVMEPDEYNDLKNNVDELKEWMQYHITTDAAWHHTSAQSNDIVFKSLDSGLPIRINVYWQLHTIAAEGVNITERNIRIANGYVQGIEGFLEQPQGDVIDIINAGDETQTLAKLLAQTGLDQVIRADQNITVFAPMDFCFEDLDSEVMTWLNANPKALEEVLLYHVVQKTTLYSIGMRHSMTFPTSDSRHDSLMLLESDDDDEELFLNHALIGERDISATNGVIHFLEAVLIPPSVLIQLEDQGLGHLIG